jgi:replicative DNA helicase
MLDDLMAIYRAEMQAGRKMPEISEVLKRVDEIVNKNAKRGVLGIRTGFESLDKVYARFIPGHIWTVGGFTSVGKTATMVQMVCNALSAPEQP